LIKNRLRVLDVKKGRAVVRAYNPVNEETEALVGEGGLLFPSTLNEKGMVSECYD